MPSFFLFSSQSCRTVFPEATDSLRYGRALFVADERDEGGDHGEGQLDEFLAAGFVRGDAFDAFFREGRGGGGEESDGFQDGLAEEGHEGLSSELTAAPQKVTVVWFPKTRAGPW